MKRVAIFILTLIALASSSAEADPCPDCSPTYGYFRHCRARCDFAQIGGICQFDSQLPQEAYCLQQVVDDPIVYSCHEGSYDCCCSRVPPPL